MNKTPDSGNLIVAMLLSLLVMVGWQYLFVQPQVEAERERLAASKPATEQTAPAPAPEAPAALLPSAPGAQQPRDSVIAASGLRVKFDNDKVDGSIRATGGRIDDLRLKKYRETIDPGSPEIVLLTPQGSQGATFAEIGWSQAKGSSVALPDAATTWASSRSALTPGSPVVLTWDNGQGLLFTRRVALDDNYMFTVTDTVENRSPASVTLYPYASVARYGEPKNQATWIQHEGLVGILENELKEETYSDLRDSEMKEVKYESTGGWLGITDKYWMATVIPPQNEKFSARFSLLPDGQSEVFRADYLLGARAVAPGARTTVTHRIFAGAKVVSLIEDYAEKLAITRFDRAVDWGWFSLIAQPMFLLLDWLYRQVGNFGVAIILLTILVKILFFPLANRSYEAMTKMKKVQPQMKEIQERYKEDRMKLQQELMALYKREKVNPMMGCLPILIQIPVFFALYKVLFVTIEMRHAPFFGWIQDLAAADPTSIFNLFGLLPYDVPSWLLVGVWPLVMGVTMWFQTKMNPPAPDPVQQQMMAWMPLIFTYLMAQFPAGLVIYWTVNNLLSILQQYVIMRRMKVPIELANNLKLPAWIARRFKRPSGEQASAGE